MKEFALTPEAASTFAAPVDTIYAALSLMTAFFVGVIALLIAIFMIRFRRAKRPHTPPETITIAKLEIGWTLIPLIGGMTFFAWGASAYLDMYREAPEQSYEVYVTAKQWMWKFQHPTGQREINELHVPLGRPVKLILISQDVIHSFFVPAFRLKHDVLPMKYTQAWFEATKTGAFHLFCAEYCGMAHSKMTGKVYVLKLHEFENWLATGPTQDSPALEGEALLQSLGCRACHSTEKTPLAPRFEGIYGKPVEFEDGTTSIIDENYLRESILNPQAKVVANYQPVMPPYAGRVTEEELAAIIAYIKSLGDQP